MNAIAETDFYAYKDYRTRIQDMIDKKIELKFFITFVAIEVIKFYKKVAKLKML